MRGDETDSAAWLDAEARRVQKLRGEARLAGLWSIAERLRKSGEIDLQIEWLETLLDATWHFGGIDYTLRALAELRRIYLTDPRFPDLRESVLWNYKQLSSEVPEHADITLETIDRVFAEMTAFYESQGESPRPVYAWRCNAALYLGHREAADDWYERWQSSPAGGSDDCEACELAMKIFYLIERDRDDEALVTGEPLIRGDVYCGATPEPLTRLMWVAHRLNQQQLADTLLFMSSAGVRRLPNLVTSLASHVVYRIFAGDVQVSRRLVMIALRRAGAHTDVDRFNVYSASGLWASMLVTNGCEKVAVPARLMPDADPATKGNIEAVQVATVCLAKAREIATALDTRNGTSRYGDKLAGIEAGIRASVRNAGP